MKQNKLETRAMTPIADTWDTTTIFKNDEAFEKAFADLAAMLPEAEKFQGRLAESADTLKKALDYRNDVVLRVEHLYSYAHLNSDVDTSDSQYQGLQSRARELYSKVGAALSYYEAELLAADEKTVRGYLEDKSLTLYKHEFEILFSRRPHILSLAEENLLAKAGNVLSASSQTFAILNNADIKFPLVKDENGVEVQLSHGRYSMFLESKDREVRKGAFKAMYETYGQLRNTFASTLSSAVKEHSFLADVRHFDSPRHQALFGNHIPESVYDSLVEAVNDRLPLLHRYVALRKRALKLDEVRMYDLYTPMVEDVELKFTYEEAQQVVLEALSVLGEEYGSLLKKAFESRWIDPYENIGKRSGAYSSGTYGTSPFILLNWQDNLDNVYTLVHELGHSMHSHYTRNYQPFIYGDYSIFVAEVASTTNENLLTDYLLKKYTEPKIQAYILNHYLDGVKGTIYRQTQFAEFEHLIHQADQQGIALTPDWLSEEYDKINRKYYGEGMAYDDEIKLEWARIPHFYYNYYVYQYATGFSAASALSAKILREGAPAVKAYIDYLKAGSSDFPIDVLKKAGVDMNTNQPTIDALDVFAQRLAQLEKVL
ncbi:MAG: oligoendopeptidase F [Erysipelotrichaceae bacterium]